MLPAIEQLLVVQDRDRRIHRLELELVELPQRKTRLRGAQTAAEAALEAARKHARQLEADRKTLELEVSSKEEFIRKCETLQGQTKSNDEYKRFTHQIETTKAEISAIEDRELDLMEKSEAAAKDVAAKAKVAAEAKAEADAQEGVIDAKVKNVEKDLAEVVADRARLAAAVDPAVLSKYQRIIDKRHDNAVVGVNGAVCGGCHMKLPQQSFLNAKAAIEIIQCPSCARILYYTRDMDPVH
jgi:uncharacterized protein